MQNRLREELGLSDEVVRLLGVMLSLHAAPQPAGSLDQWETHRHTHRDTDTYREKYEEMFQWYSG